MRLPISNLNKLFENRVRLGIMSVLMVNKSYDFNSLKETLAVTDGNLASHLKALEENGLIIVSKQFIGKKPNTRYSITEEGRISFGQHLKALEEIIKSQ
ncbi:MAG TPA: transcriptional regulator [Bacteroidales bacterium]|nr:transcriptional regulator [Bacteroidales bacterium]